MFILMYKNTQNNEQRYHNVAHPLHQNLLRDVTTMNVSIKECEEWISDLFHIKQLQQSRRAKSTFLSCRKYRP